MLTEPRTSVVKRQLDPELAEALKHSGGAIDWCAFSSHCRHLGASLRCRRPSSVMRRSVSGSSVMHMSVSG